MQRPRCESRGLNDGYRDGGIWSRTDKGDIDKRCHYGLPKWNEWRHFPVEFVSNMERILGRRGVRLLVENWGGFQMVHNDIQLADA